jgi:hypothetical protein
MGEKGIINPDFLRKLNSDTRMLVVNITWFLNYLDYLEQIQTFAVLKFERNVNNLMASFLGCTFGNVHQSSNQLQDKTCCLHHQRI